MGGIAASWALLTGLALASPASADEVRDLCPDRPGLGTPACTVAPGSVVGELGIGDWTHESDRQSRTDTVLAGDALVRVGLADHLEGQVGWTAFGRQRSRDRATGADDTGSGVGDVTLALRRNLRHPDGSGLSLALMPYASLPVGTSPAGAGDWGAGLLLPISLDLSDALSIQLTPELDAAVDEDGSGRHLAYGSVIGLGLAVSERLSATAEVSVFRDRDPGGHRTPALAGLSAGWQPNDDTQFDVGVNLAISADSPDRQIYLGVVRRF